MTIPTGGSATISGIIYQMLWSLLEASRIHISSTAIDSTNRHMTGASLVLEPRGGGGDVLVCTPEKTRIQQLKLKSDGGTWSLRLLIKEILPDLYRGVDRDSEAIGAVQQFEFITSGRMGSWANVNNFFRSLASRPAPQNRAMAHAALDDSKRIHFGGSLSEDGVKFSNLTEREIFDQVVQSLRISSPANEEDIDLTYRKTWKLLSHLDYRWGLTPEAMQADLQKRIRAVIDARENTEAKLQQMLMSLAQKASSGDAVIDSTAFFGEHGLDAVPLNQWHKLISNSLELLQKTYSGLGYQPKNDIRAGDPLAEISEWYSGAIPYLALAGESGQGKTWSLCRLAQAISQEAPVILLSARSTGLADKNEAARLFWENVCGHDTPLSLDRITQRLAEAVPERAGTCLYVLIDNILSYDEAEQLVTEMSAVSGVRLALTAPPDVAQYFTECAHGKARLCSVDSFSDSELRRLVADSDPVRWYAIPDDVRNIIRLPLLANLYRELTSDGKWSPVNEYELYSRHYQKKLIASFHRKSPMGLLAMRCAALAVWHDDRYPWTLEFLAKVGLNDEMLKLLVAIGWLKGDEQGRYRVWHDRLMQWQVAEAVATSLADGTLQAEDVAAKCRQLWNDQRPVSTQRLSYVPMDLIWLLAQRGAEVAGALDTILAIIPQGFHADRTFYQDLLPTIGESIAPAIFWRMEQLAQEDEDERQASHTLRAITDTLERLPLSAVSPDAIRLLASDDGELRGAGIRLLRIHPSREALEPLWRRFLVVQQDSNEGYELQRHNQDSSDQRGNLWESMDLWAALRSCVPLAPDWLERTLQSPESEPGLDALVAFLRKVPDGLALWRQFKNSLRDRVSGDSARQFAYNIFWWRDDEETSWLLNHLEVEDYGIGATCYRALIRVSTEAALHALPRFNAGELYATRACTFAELIAQEPEATLKTVREQVLNSEARWSYAAAFRDEPNRIDVGTLEALISNLYPALESGTSGTLWRAFQSLEELATLSQLQCLWKLAGTDWEERLVSVILERSPLPGYCHDVTLTSLVTVLYKIGGSGFTRVINRWLSANTYYTRMSGIREAHLRPNEQTIQLLEDLALKKSPVMEKSDEKANETLAYLAQEALATAGAWSSVIRTIIDLREKSSREVVWTGEGRISDEIMAPAFDILRDSPADPGAIFSLGFGSRDDYIPHIVQILESSMSNGVIVNSCVWALAAMPKIGPDATNILIELLNRGESHYLLPRILVHEGSDSAANALLSRLSVIFTNESHSPHVSYDVANMVYFLLKNPTTSESTIKACRERIQRGENLDQFSKALIRTLSSDAQAKETDSEYRSAALKVLDSERVRQFLEYEAFQASRGIRFVGNKAMSIRGLGVFKPEDAYIAALRILRDSEAHDREYAPYTLLDIDSRRATDDLISHLTIERSSVVRMNIARAIASYEPSFTSLLDSLKDTEYTTRQAACFALGFARPNPDIEIAVRCCLQDPHPDVYKAACEALNRLHRASCTEEIARAFSEENDTSKQWILLDAALEMGDIGGEHGPNPWWIDDMRGKMTPFMLKHASKAHEKRRKEETSNLEREDRQEK